MNKFHARATTVDNIRFHSAREAAYYQQLLCLLRTGKIRDLQLQVRFPLECNGVRIGVYVADFTYFDEDGSYHIIDVKGVRTAVYRLKKRILDSQGIHIEEV